MKKQLQKIKNINVHTKILLTLIFIATIVVFSIGYVCPANAKYCFNNQQEIKETEINTNYKNDDFGLNPIEFQKKIGEGAVLIDIRRLEEYNNVHIQGTLLIDYYSSDFVEQLSNLNKDKEYVIYCRIGTRTGETIQIMKNLGFENVHDLSGGITEWENQGFPVIRWINKNKVIIFS